MRLSKARVQNYRSIKDTGWFDIEHGKTIMVGPNEAGKTAVLQALQQINAPDGVDGFDALRDYPRSNYNDIKTGKSKPEDIVVASVSFMLESDDKGEMPAGFEDCTYVVHRYLNNEATHTIEGGSQVPTFGDVKKDFARLCSHIDAQLAASTAESGDSEKPSESFNKITEGWIETTSISSSYADKLITWLDGVYSHIDENNSAEEGRFDKLKVQISTAIKRDQALKTLDERTPVFVLFNNYFRVHPLIILQHLADRLDGGLLDDDQYDYGNQCLLKLLGFTARELSDLGKAVEPAANDKDAVKAYRDQLDIRRYQLNAASVRLTEEIRTVWQPDIKRSEADSLIIQADAQYLKAVVSDELGVDIELNQRSEGFQWLVSFFIVFFAEAADKHENAILLLDEPGLSLHGLKQREFRKTITRLAETNQTVYTTHSPFLVGPDELDLVRVVEMNDRKVGTKVHTDVIADNPAALLPLQEALGYDLAQSLFSQERNLVLEGLTDYWYIDATAQLLRDAKTIDLNKKIALVPASSAGKVVYFATILHAQKLKVAALLDSDAAGEQAAQQEVLVHKLGNKGILRTKDAYSGKVTKPEIEDLLRETLVSVAKDDLGWDITSTASAQPARPIIDIFSDEINDFSKYRLAKAYLRWTRVNDAKNLSTNERKDWKALLERINKALK